MLMQLLMGNVISDEEIIQDYYRSNAETTRIAVLKNSKGDNGSDAARTEDAPSAAAAAMAMVVNANVNANTVGTGSSTGRNNKRIKMDKIIFGGTNRPAMISTLEGLRHRHGQFDRAIPRYFDRIGFDESWRKRFRKSFRTTPAKLDDDHDDDDKHPVRSRL